MRQNSRSVHADATSASAGFTLTSPPLSVRCGMHDSAPFFSQPAQHHSFDHISANKRRPLSWTRKISAAIQCMTSPLGMWPVAGITIQLLQNTACRWKPGSPLLFLHPGPTQTRLQKDRGWHLQASMTPIVPRPNVCICTPWALDNERHISPLSHPLGRFVSTTSYRM